MRNVYLNEWFKLAWGLASVNSAARINALCLLRRPGNVPKISCLNTDCGAGRGEKEFSNGNLFSRDVESYEPPPFSRLVVAVRGRLDEPCSSQFLQ